MITPWRRLAEAFQAIIIVGLPFLIIDGESALRFDVPTLVLHFFGLNLWMEEFFIVLVALLFLSLFLIFVTLLLGRIWCGWLCPQTVLSDFTLFVERAKNKRVIDKLIAYALMFLISILVAANLIWYFVSPYEFIPDLLKGSLGNVIWGFWIVLTGIIFLNFLLLRQKFCATVCPYGKLQGILFDKKTLVVAFDPHRKEECIDCMACVKACPVAVDIRNGLNSACIHCAICIDSCTMVMSSRQKKSLIGYFFGLPGEGGRVLRQNVVLVGSVTAVFLVFFFYLLLVRVPLDMTVLPNYAFQPRITDKGTIVNSYVLSLKNRGRLDVELQLAVTGINSILKIAPEKGLHIKAGDLKRLPVYITVRDFKERGVVKDMEIAVKSIRDDKLHVARKANFIVPER
jgi:cytochrome c oxidase accessory protein FixG